MKCKSEIQPRYDGSSRGRCSRNAKKDGYCKIHHPEYKKSFVYGLRKVMKQIEKKGLKFTAEEKRQFLEMQYADQLAKLLNYKLGTTGCK